MSIHNYSDVCQIIDERLCETHTKFDYSSKDANHIKWCNEFSEYTLFESDLNCLTLEKYNIEMTEDLIFSIIVPEDFKDFMTVLNIIDHAS